MRHVGTKKEPNLEIHQRIVVMLCVFVGLVAPGLSVAKSSSGSVQEISQAESAVPGLHDFDFLQLRYTSTQ